MQLQTTFPESKFPNEYICVICTQIDQHLKKLLKKYKGFPILWNTVYNREHTHTTVLLLFWNMSGTTQVSRYQKGKTRKVKTNLDLLEQE